VTAAAKIEPVEKIWVDGELVDWERAQFHALCHTLHYGLGVFEGIRAYRTQDGRAAVFRLPEHLERLLNSAKIVGLPMRFSRDDLHDAVLATLRTNRLQDAYIRPIAFLGAGSMGLGATDNPTRTVVAVFRWGAYLGEDGLKKGIRTKVSSFARQTVNSSMTTAKVTGAYVNSILAKREALAAGCDEAIMLNTLGYVSEGSGENLFFVSHDEIVTPPLSAAILPGITRASVITLAEDRKLRVVERNATRDELYTADEVFLTGTAAEVTPVAEVDGRAVGSGRPGPVTLELQRAYGAAVRGQDPRHPEWLTFV
jgi:branched-chain amino acid aminotransferase